METLSKLTDFNTTFLDGCLAYFAVSEKQCLTSAADTRLLSGCSANNRRATLRMSGQEGIMTRVVCLDYVQHSSW